MKLFRCIIAPVGSPSMEQTVEIEAKDLAEALVINCQLRPGTYVKEISEI